ncbi:hypothetical protein NL458_26220, partial [Klebsiella pneumoniae]|nr:hypothetical protein [Klebsiella pneumoniae]
PGNLGPPAKPDPSLLLHQQEVSPSSKRAKSFIRLALKKRSVQKQPVSAPSYIDTEQALRHVRDRKARRHIDDEPAPKLTISSECK